MANWVQLETPAVWRPPHHWHTAPFLVSNSWLYKIYLLTCGSKIILVKFNKEIKDLESSIDVYKKKIAEDNDMSLAQMSLAFVNERPFLTSNIIGATTIKQLEENISSSPFFNC